MRKELDDKLCAHYPEIFRDRRADASSTAMCWGFDCGDGWYSLIDGLCSALMSPVYNARSLLKYYETAPADTNYYTEEQWAALKEQTRAKLAEVAARVPVATQVKEKYGTLRFYVKGASDEQYAMITLAEHLSAKVCETCGSMNARQWGHSWITTMCQPCATDEFGELMIEELLAEEEEAAEEEL